ncbi:MAG: DUF5916 domain-containing protein [Sphingobacteriaceae bacterium]
MRFSLLYILLFFSFSVLAQNDLRIIKAKHISGKITIDGVVDEQTWLDAERSGNFWQNFPYDTSLSEVKTEVMVSYDEDNLYIAAICHDSIQHKYVIQSLKRDFSYPVSDAFVATIDPFSDQQNGFSFGMNPYGVQREGLVSNGGGQGVTTIWDNKWYGETKRYADKWTLEMQIPFKSIRFKENLDKWRINFSRNDLNLNENSSWVRVPRQFNISTLAFTGVLQFEKAPFKNGSNVSLIPYGIGRFSEDYYKPGSQKKEWNAGADAKMVLGSSMNLDMTINPDFSQVEVDRQITNLTRFSLFFPEQRQFFIENSDLFDRFGFRQIRPFFSRRIGLNNGEIIPIIGGARLSGKPSKNWRIGVMDIQTADKTIANTKVFSQNYFVAAAQYNVFKRSNIAAIFVNRQQFDTTGYSVNNYNRVAGLDYNLSSANNKWNGKFFFHHSFTNKANHNAFTHASWLNYTSQNWSIEWNHEYVDRNYNAETGFTPRMFQTDVNGRVNKFTYWRLEPHIYYFVYPKNSKINKIGHTAYLDHYRNQKFQNTDWFARGSYDLYFKSSSYISFFGTSNYTKLLFATDVSFTGQKNVTAAGDYFYHNGGFQLKSNQRKVLVASLTGNYGTYYSGNKFSMAADLSYRVQPYVIFSVNYTRDEIYLPYLSKKVELNLISPRIEMSFSRSLFLTTFWQYNSQAKNINFNGRLQWRFKPMSDLFIVYSDNYDNNDFSIKNRAIVVKFVYWLNM